MIEIWNDLRSMKLLMTGLEFITVLLLLVIIYALIGFNYSLAMSALVSTMFITVLTIFGYKQLSKLKTS